MAQRNLALLGRRGLGSQHAFNHSSFSLPLCISGRCQGTSLGRFCQSQRAKHANCWRYSGNACAARCAGVHGETAATGNDQAGRIRSWRVKPQETIGIRYQNVNNLSCGKLKAVVESGGEYVQCFAETGLGVGYSFLDVQRDLKACKGSKKAFMKTRGDCKRRSGGTGIVFPESLASNVTVANEYDELDWIVPFQVHLKERNLPLAVAVCYVPGGEKYFDPCMTKVLGEVFSDLQKYSSGVIFLGDFNVQIGDHPGCECPWIAKHFPRRTQNETKKNVKRLNSLIKSGAIINNGRASGDMMGKPTNYHHTHSWRGTEIDYVISDTHAFPDVLRLEKGSLNRRISSHVPIECTISKHSFFEAHRDTKSKQIVTN